MEREKAVGLFRLSLNEILKPLRLYGQDPFVDLAREELVKAALLLHERLKEAKPLQEA